jgi:hypothetical protein
MGFETERAMAERAMSAYEREATVEASFPAAARRIRLAREALGLTQDEVADRWGEQPSMYWDLELYDDEAFTVISVRQLQCLAVALETSVNRLLFGHEPIAVVAAVHYADVVARLQARAIEESISIEQLGDRIGWDVAPLLTDSAAVGELPIVGLWSVCQEANVDWVSVINAESCDA